MISTNTQEKSQGYQQRGVGGGGGGYVPPRKIIKICTHITFTFTAFTIGFINPYNSLWFFFAEIRITIMYFNDFTLITAFSVSDVVCSFFRHLCTNEVMLTNS